MSFFFEDAQLGADGGVARLAGQLLHHLGGGGASAAEQDIHDLALAARENGVQRSGHRRIHLVLCISHVVCDRNNMSPAASQIHCVCAILCTVQLGLLISAAEPADCGPTYDYAGTTVDKKVRHYVPVDGAFYFVRHKRARRYLLGVEQDVRVRVTIPRGGSRREAEAFAGRSLKW